jgi:hypothetical protein
MRNFHWSDTDIFLMWSDFMALMAGLSWKELATLLRRTERIFLDIPQSGILVALPGRESSAKIHGLHLWGENSKIGKEKILSGLCKQILPHEQMVFSNIRKKWLKICTGIRLIFLQCTITNIFRISRLISLCPIANNITNWEMSILTFLAYFISCLF